VLIFDDTIQEKAWTDERELMCGHFDPCSGRTIGGINLLNALYATSPRSKLGRSFCGKVSRHAQRPGMRCKGAVSLPAMTSTRKARRVLAISAL
jgi:hypothetical protein